MDEHTCDLTLSHNSRKCGVKGNSVAERCRTEERSVHIRYGLRGPAAKRLVERRRMLERRRKRAHPAHIPRVDILVERCRPEECPYQLRDVARLPLAEGLKKGNHT